MAQTANEIAPMRVEDFLVFIDSRPDGEKWELIDGEPISSRLENADASLDPLTLGIGLPLAQIYWQTGLLEA